MKFQKQLYLILFALIQSLIIAQSTININLNSKFQTIDGFGCHQGNDEVNDSRWQKLYYDDLAASIYRVDLTPKLRSPYSDLSYFSPWFMGSSVKSVFNLEDPSNPDGPEKNRVRTYTGPNDYGRLFGGRNAPIAVMGPNIEDNVKYFVYSPNGAISAGLSKKNQLGDFKLIGSLWSPVPWVKVSSGNAYNQDWWPGPINGAKWPFIWGGNFAGGRLDVSNTPLEVFNDASQGGTGRTSSLTQFARSTAAYILGYQRYHKVQFYAISIQNELNFEQFYNSASYPLSSQYITALKLIRAEFDQYPELRNIRLMGPEDLLGGDAYGMWEYGGPVHKNLQYLANIAKDTAALKAVDFYCIHGYDYNGVSSAGANSNLWNWWANGWTTSPAPGIPANVKGFTSFNKKSWMTETSGEVNQWLNPGSGFPSNGGWSIALKIHHALTTGLQSAWLYWTFTDVNSTGTVTDQGLTSIALGETSPKYAAVKHFMKWVRPNMVRVNAATNQNDLYASSYFNDSTGNLVTVLINAGNQTKNCSLAINGRSNLKTNPIQFVTSSNNSYLKSTSGNLTNGTTNFSIPAYGVVTLSTTIASNTSTQEDLRSLDLHLVNQSNSYFFNLDEDAFLSYELYDNQGQMLSRQEKQFFGKGQHELDTKNILAGVYYVQFRIEDQSIITKKLIKF